jgi:hypothetical protein
MPGKLRRKQVGPFTPVVMIAEQHRVAADMAAIEHLHRLHRLVFDTMDTERSRKATIGISEIGGDCPKCVARKLSGLYPPSPPSSDGWKAQIGTMGHDYLERHLQEKFPWMFEQVEVELPNGQIIWKTRTREDVEPTASQPIYYLERKLKVLDYKGHLIDGSCDLFTRILLTEKHFQERVLMPDGRAIPVDPGTHQPGDEIGVVSDWKFQGPSKLEKTAKGQVGAAYTTQMHTYGLGYELDGLHPTHVDLHALPRDDDLDASKPVLFRYDRQVALDGLKRLVSLIDMAEMIGWPATIEAQPTGSPCWDCDGFEAIEEVMFMRDLTG